MVEHGIVTLDDNTFTYESSPKMKKKRRKVEATTSGLKDTMKHVIALCNTDTEKNKENILLKREDILVEN